MRSNTIKSDPVEVSFANREVSIDGRKRERVTAYFLDGNETPLVAWTEGDEEIMAPCARISIAPAPRPASAPSAPAAPVVDAKAPASKDKPSGE